MLEDQGQRFKVLPQLSLPVPRDIWIIWIQRIPHQLCSRSQIAQMCLQPLKCRCDFDITGPEFFLRAKATVSNLLSLLHPPHNQKTTSALDQPGKRLWMPPHLLPLPRSPGFSVHCWGFQVLSYMSQVFERIHSLFYTPGTRHIPVLALTAKYVPRLSRHWW